MLVRMPRKSITHVWLWEIQNSTTMLEISLAISLNLYLLHNELSTFILERWRKESYIQMFVVAFFITAPNWKQFRCSSTDEWLNNLANLYHRRLLTKTCTCKQESVHATASKDYAEPKGKNGAKGCILCELIDSCFIKVIEVGTGVMVQWGKCLPQEHGDLSSDP